MTCSFPDLEPVCFPMSSSNSCFLTCIQISWEAGQVVWYSHLFQNFPQFVVIYTVKGFGIVNKTETDVFLELSRFFDDPTIVGNLISWVPLPYCSPPGCPFPIKSLALSADVSPWTIHFWVLDKSPVSGPGRGSLSCNNISSFWWEENLFVNIWDFSRMKVSKCNRHYFWKKWKTDAEPEEKSITLEHQGLLA